MTNTRSLQFKKLSISDKSLVESVTAKFEPYSDFNFISLLSWDDGTTEICTLNDNLVIKIADYITGKPVYSILGTNKVDESLETLLSLTKELKLVPEVVAQSCVDRGRFHIIEDRDNFDYIYAVDTLVSLAGKGFKDKRNRISRFLRNTDDKVHIKEVDLSDKATKDSLETVFLKWAQEKDKEDHETQNENDAIKKLLDNVRFFSLIGLQVNIGGQIVGFSINELTTRAFAICHFQKSILSYTNVDIFLTNIVAKELEKKGCKYVNWEQDLGLPGLKQLKMSYKPDHFLKKYTIRRVA